MGGWAGLLIVYPIVYEDTAFSLSCVLGRALVLVVSACGEQKILALTMALAMAGNKRGSTMIATYSFLGFVL